MRLRLTTIAIVLAWLFTPDTLCLIPGVNLVPDEAECCRRMADDCGRTPMPSSHSCCKPVPKADSAMAAKATKAVDPDSVATLDAMAASVKNVHIASDFQRFSAEIDSPLPLTATHSVLRI